MFGITFIVKYYTNIETSAAVHVGIAGEATNATRERGLELVSHPLLVPPGFVHL
jgi:hypothetical protein